MATNEVTTLRNAIVALLIADSSMQTLAGRPAGFVVLWDSIATATRPVMAFQIVSSIRVGGSGHRRRVQVLMAAFAQGNGAQDKVEALTRRVREVLTSTALGTQSIDAIVSVADESSGGLGEDGLPAQEARHDLTLTIETTAPL
jgi:hypothetical protein